MAVEEPHGPPTDIDMPPIDPPAGEGEGVVDGSVFFWVCVGGWVCVWVCVCMYNREKE